MPLDHPERDTQFYLPAAFLHPVLKCNNPPVKALLSTNRELHSRFAPFFWQSLQVTFFEPDVFANSFLAFSTDAAIRDIRHLTMLLRLGRPEPEQNLRANRERIITLTKCLAEMACVYKALKALEVFHLSHDPDDTGPRTCYYAEKMEESGRNLQEQFWDLVDRHYGGCFSRLSERVMRKTFRGFDESRRVVFDDEYTSSEIWLFGIEMEWRKKEG
jgi:hypothetical protein